jgi:hypothetical protein
MTPADIVVPSEAILAKEAAHGIFGLKIGELIRDRISNKEPWVTVLETEGTPVGERDINAVTIIELPQRHDGSVRLCLGTGEKNTIPLVANRSDLTPFLDVVPSSDSRRMILSFKSEAGRIFTYSRAKHHFSPETKLNIPLGEGAEMLLHLRTGLTAGDTENMQGNSEYMALEYPFYATKAGNLFVMARITESDLIASGIALNGNVFDSMSNLSPDQIINLKVQMRRKILKSLYQGSTLSS